MLDFAIMNWDSFVHACNQSYPLKEKQMKGLAFYMKSSGQSYLPVFTK
jgi:hypothetical protein